MKLVLVLADMKKVYDDLIIIKLYLLKVIKDQKICIFDFVQPSKKRLENFLNLEHRALKGNSLMLKPVFLTAWKPFQVNDFLHRFP